MKAFDRWGTEQEVPSCPGPCDGRHCNAYQPTRTRSPRLRPYEIFAHVADNGREIGFFELVIKDE